MYVLGGRQFIVPSPVCGTWLHICTNRGMSSDRIAFADIDAVVVDLDLLAPLCRSVTARVAAMPFGRVSDLSVSVNIPVKP